jgi:hypothetical protein
MCNLKKINLLVNEWLVLGSHTSKEKSRNVKKSWIKVYSFENADFD